MRILDPIRDRGRRNPGRVTRAARELGQPGLAQRDVEGSHADPALEVCRVFRRAPRDLEGLATRAGPSVHRLGQHRREGFGPGGLHGGPALLLDRLGDRFSRLLMHHLPTPTRPPPHQARPHPRPPHAEHSPPPTPPTPAPHPSTPHPHPYSHPCTYSYSCSCSTRRGCLAAKPTPCSCSCSTRQRGPTAKVAPCSYSTR